KTPPDADPTLAGTFSTRQWFHTLFADWKRTWGRWDLDVTLAAGPQHFDGNVGAAARFNLDLVELDLRFEAVYRGSRRLRMTYGLDLQGDYFWVSVDAPQQTTEEVPLGPLGERPRVSLRDRGLEVSPAVYVQGEVWAIAIRLLLVAGVRADRLSGQDRVLVQPRLSGRLKIATETWLKA